LINQRFTLKKTQHCCVFLWPKFRIHCEANHHHSAEALPNLAFPAFRLRHYRCDAIMSRFFPPASYKLGAV
jgi:hypothetical protein